MYTNVWIRLIFLKVKNVQCPHVELDIVARPLSYIDGIGGSSGSVNDLNLG